jgi:hypothetical protein
MKLYELIFEKEAPSKKSILKVLVILSVITVVEVFIALYILVWNEPPQNTEPLYYIYRITMIVLSLLKAFFIVAEFMHMWYEVRRFVFYTLISVVNWFLSFLLSRKKLPSQSKESINQNNNVVVIKV